MRTPNTECLLCSKPLYRRPYELAKVRYAACMACRSEAQKVAGITVAQRAGLRLGQPKGHKRRLGYKHRDESKQKTSAKNKAFWAANPAKAIERACRAERHYLWRGGITQLNQSIRQMVENRKWMDAVKARDGKCVRCGSVNDLESHHKKSLAEIIASCDIRSRDDARRFGSVVWDLNNGETLCRSCHFLEHDRKVAA